MTEIKVGDTVRIKDNYPFPELGNNVGVEFKVTNRVNQSFAGHEFYVEGDPAGRGIWANFIERVEVESEPETTRWRYNDHIVVYPGTPNKHNAHGRRGVTVLDESIPRVFERWEDAPFERQDEVGEAARAYWAAHPEPKPWYDAKDGELWEISTGFRYKNVAAVVKDGHFYMKSAYDYASPDSIDVRGVVEAKRIYPEATQ